MVELTSLFGIDISQQWAVMAGILTVYFLKDKIFDEVSMAKFFAQRRVAKSDNKRAVDKINSTFPSAVSSDELVAVVKKTLREHGFRRATTTLVTALCPEQFNRETEKKLSRAYGENVPIGGLAGFPFGGVQSFEEVADNMVRSGDALIMHGPHLSVTEDGVLQTSCHSAKKAASYIESVRNGGAEMKLDDCMEDGLCVDVEQYFLQNTLMPFGDRLAAAKGDATELPMVLYDAQADMMDELVTEGCKKHEIEGFVCLLGGVQINTPSGVADYFLPMRFELRDKKGQLVKDLMW